LIAASRLYSITFGVGVDSGEESARDESAQRERAIRLKNGKKEVLARFRKNSK
jgi:hypothetical protein